MRKSSMLIGVFAIMVFGGALAGCSQKSSAPETSGQAPAESTAAPAASAAEKPQALVWNMGSEPKTWDPTLSSETLSEYITISMFEGLTRQSADGIEPGVAESWDVSDDGLTYTFHLRKSNWSDGTPLTAHDFEYTWRRLCDPAVASPSAAGVTDYVVGAAEYLAGTGTADEVMAHALDDYTFEVVLKNPAPFFLSRISADIYCPVNKKCVDLGEGWEKRPETFICNGPFILGEYQIGSHILMVKNDAYYDADSIKMPAIKGIMINDENTSLQGYKAGDIHCTEVIPAEEIPTLLAEDPNLYVSPLTGTKYLDFNVDRDPVSDVKVRRALTLAINRKLITDQITRSGEIPASGFLPITTQKTDGSSYRTLQANGLPEPAFGISPDSADVDTAKQLLAEAGFPDGEGFPELELLYYTGESDKKICEAIQQMWKENLGITVKLRNEDKSVALQTKADGKYDISLSGWSAGYYDASQMMKQFKLDSGCYAQWRYAEHPSAPHDHTLNPGQKAFEDAYQAAMAAQGTERDELWAQAETVLMEEAPACPIYYYVLKALINEDVVTNVEFSKTGNWIFRNAEFVD
ncbi:peptide ABC transporter substrate-binding protein [uncultured Clostridium sp.]|uniref:peptide ABC transporter substrate-binding protein n=1 Tax=uncultured Clostridium sp. TaxID=59620 RepID=UPI0025F41E45|nr:peptide ABC transporter substrate-binding protein [uncultured Clostridium sp.]